MHVQTELFIWLDLNTFDVEALRLLKNRVSTPRSVSSLVSIMCFISQFFKTRKRIQVIYLGQFNNKQKRILQQTLAVIQPYEWFEVLFTGYRPQPSTFSP